MPYVRISTSVKMSEETISSVRAIVGDTIRLIPGKSFEVTIIHIEPECVISRGDPANPMMFIEVRLFGPSATSAKQDFTREVSAALEKLLGIEQKYMALNIIEMDSWGGNGNFRTFR